MPLGGLLHGVSEDLKAELQLIFNSIVEGVCGIDRWGNCTFCNDAFLQLTRYTADEVVGKNLHALLRHSRRDGSKYPTKECMFQAAITENRPTHVVGEFLWRKDGTWFPAEYWSHPLQSSAGHTAHVATFLDITERELAAEALRASEERFQQISDNIEQVFYLVDVRDGAMVYISPAFEKLWGRSCESLYKNPETWLEAVVPEHQDKVMALQKRLLAGEEIREEFKIVRPDGSTRWIQDHANPIFNAQGQVCKFAGVAEDITEAKEARDAIRQSEEKYRSLIRNMPDVVWSVDSQQRVLFISPNVERLLGYSEEELYTQGARLWFESVHPEDAAKVSQAFEALFTKGEPYDVECRVRRKDGRWIWAHDRALGTYEKNGVRCADGMVSDITARKRAELAVDESERRHRLFFERNLAGVFRTTLSARMTDCNPALLRILGYESAEEVVGHSWHEFLYDPEEARMAFDRLFRERSLSNYEVRLRTKQGSPVWVLENVCIVEAEDSQAAFIEGTVVNISERKRAEQELRDSEDKLRLLLESTAEAIYGIDLHGCCTFCNPACLRLLGYQHADQLLGKNMHDLIHHSLPDGSKFPVEECRIFRAFKKGEGTHVDDEVLWKADGTSFPAEYWSYPQRKGQEVVGAVVAFIDISERKRAEEELRSKTAFLEAQTNSTVDGILVVDGKGERILRNQRFIEIFDIPKHILQEPGDQKMLEYVIGKIKSPEQFVERVKYLYAHPSETSRDEIEFTDGTVLDRYSSPVVGNRGEYYGRIWTFRDMTERKRAESALRDSEEQFREIAETIREVFFVLTPEPLRMTYISPAYDEIWGRSREELYADPRRWMESVYADDQGRVATFTAHSRQDAPAKEEYRILRPDGSMRWIRARTFPVHNAEGEFYRAVGIAEDVTEQRSLEQQLRQGQKLEAIGQLSAGIAHEINTPTQFVSDNLTFLRESWQSVSELLTIYRDVIQGVAQANCSQPARDAIAEAEHNADLEYIASEIPRAIDQALDGMQRVSKIVRAMREFSHPDSAEKTATDINKAIETTVTVARNEWKYFAEIETSFDASLPAVPCYAGEVNQVILNLIVNAAHAIKAKNGEGEKGRITICTHTRGEIAEIAISDTGTGIPEAIRTRVFDPFFTTKEVGKGTGQGLALAHSIIVKKHGGKIWFESEEGRGTTFFIHLPINPSSGGQKG